MVKEIWTFKVLEAKIFSTYCYIWADAKYSLYLLRITSNANKWADANIYYNIPRYPSDHIKMQDKLKLCYSSYLVHIFTSYVYVSLPRTHAYLVHTLTLYLRLPRTYTYLIRTLTSYVHLPHT